MLNQKSAVSMFPEYFYFNQVMFRVTKDGKLEEVEKGKGLPETTEGLVETQDVSARINYTQGRVLTVIEAAISNVGQQKAVKDLIKQIFSEEHAQLSDSVTGFKTLSQGDMYQFGGGSLEKFYEDNGIIETVTKGQ